MTVVGKHDEPASWWSGCDWTSNLFEAVWFADSNEAVLVARGLGDAYTEPVQTAMNRYIRLGGSVPFEVKEGNRARL